MNTRSTAWLGVLVVVLFSLPAEAVKFRRPYSIGVSLGYGFDNNYSAGGCDDWSCGNTCYNTHTGSDFPLPTGSDVLAGAPGTVVTASSGCANTGYVGNPCGGKCGNYVKVRHADNSDTIYCHMKNGTLTVAVGNTVTCGQKLGQSASSGSSSGPHLHFGWAPTTGGSRSDPFKGNCSSSSAWVSQGAYPGKPSTNCEIQCECTPGQSQNQACGSCGTQKRTCSSNCSWGGWGGCTGQGACKSGASQNQACGNCGSQKRTCNSSCSWGGWGSCGAQGTCAPASNQAEACGNCGSRSRSCSSSCAWNAWGSCGDEGECAPGTAQAEACCDCGERTRECGAGCGWPEWSDCAGPDPEGAPGCDTGKLGDCAEGVLKCATGCLTCADLNAPTDEQCDGRDNDCDGSADEHAFEMGTPSPPFAAKLIDVSAPGSLRAGEDGMVWAEFLNTGSETWMPGEVTLMTYGPGGELSALWYPGEWSAWDIPATVDKPTAPGESTRFVFPVQLAGDSENNENAIVTKFAVSAKGVALVCPSPGFEVEVMPLDAVEHDDSKPLRSREVVAHPGQGGSTGGSGEPAAELDEPSNPRAGTQTEGCSASPTTGNHLYLLVIFGIPFALLSVRRRLAARV